MALAPFFEKTALAASHLLRGFDADAFRQTLESHVVGVSFDADAVRSSEGKVTLELAVNLLARLYPRIAIAARGEPDGAETARLTALARAINPHIEILDRTEDATVCLAVGSTPVLPNLAVVYVGSDGWIVGVSPDAPVGSGNSTNSLGACAAACFGTANVFRVVFSDQISRGELDATWRASLLDLDRQNACPPNPGLEKVDLGESHLIGVGAIGNAAVWGLARLPFLRGTLHLVDHEAVDDTNPQRYVLTELKDIGTPKVLLGERVLRSTNLEVHPHAQTWGQYLRERSDWRLDRVAVALDTPEDRCAVQAALPRWIVNAWTQPEDLGVSRHAFLGDQACLMCLYMPEKERPDLDDEMVRALRLPPEALRDVRTLLVNGNPIGLEWIERIAEANRLPADFLHQFKDLPIHAFYQRAVCGGAMLALGANDDGVRHAEVPMAFQSALAGILLAAELVAHAAGARDVAPPAATKINLLAPLGTDLSLPAPKHPKGRCICQDEDYRAAYQEKYTASESMARAQ